MYRWPDVDAAALRAARMERIAEQMQAKLEQLRGTISGGGIAVDAGSRYDFSVWARSSSTVTGEENDKCRSTSMTSLSAKIDKVFAITSLSAENTASRYPSSPTNPHEPPS